MLRHGKASRQGGFARKSTGLRDTVNLPAVARRSSPSAMRGKWESPPRACVYAFLNIPVYVGGVKNYKKRRERPAGGGNPDPCV